jgi:hypothetical protein
MANNISEHPKTKLDALVAYQVEIQDEPNARSLVNAKRRALNLKGTAWELCQLKD